MSINHPANANTSAPTAPLPIIQAEITTPSNDEFLTQERLAEAKLVFDGIHIRVGQIADNDAALEDSKVEHTQELGLSDDDLKNLIQGLRMDDKPFMQRARLNATIRNHNLQVNPARLLAGARRYQTEQITTAELGKLFHYHQTSLDNLDNILQLGALMSYNEQKQIGTVQRGAGSRPDVVQFTRDHYDKDGNLVEPGLVRAGTLGVAGDIALVFDETIMQTPNYDSIVKYPNTPSASLDLLKAITVADENDIQTVRSLIAKKGIEAEVLTRQQWLDTLQERNVL